MARLNKLLEREKASSLAEGIQHRQLAACALELPASAADWVAACCQQCHVINVT